MTNEEIQAVIDRDGHLRHAGLIVKPIQLYINGKHADLFAIYTYGKYAVSAYVKIEGNTLEEMITEEVTAKTLNELHQKIGEYFHQYPVAGYGTYTHRPFTQKEGLWIAKISRSKSCD
jgi:hypothetical protein